MWYYVVICLVMFLKEGTAMATERDLVRINTLQDIAALFSLTPQEIEAQTGQYCAQMHRELDELLSLPADVRTFENTIQRLDDIISFSNFMVFTSVVQLLGMVHPDEVVRTAAQAAEVALSAFRIDAVVANVPLYQMCKVYAEGPAQRENLSEDQRYHLTNLLAGWQREGLGLPDAQRAKVMQLRKEIDALGVAFSANIASDNRTILVSRDGLAGLSEEFIATLQQSPEGLSSVGTDYPTFTMVMENCTVEETRKQLYRMYQNRAYPVNDGILRDVFAKRHEVAQLLGFETYAHLDLEECMAQNPATVETFLEDLFKKARTKELVEFKELTRELPASVTLAGEGKLKPWDVPYLQAWYKTTHLSLDEQVVAEYFPQDVVMRGLFSVYETFFNLTFVEKPVPGMWHEEVRLVEIYDRASSQLLGYVLLDLHPRPHKYEHACQATIVPAVSRADGTQPPALVIVIANFARGSATRPALWHRKQAVNTLFHEFGHALHSILGRTKLASRSGTGVRWDFVELPSQMLENWLLDVEILKKVSCHYKTGEPLPDDIAAKIKELKHHDSGYFVARQVNLALLSLIYHQNKGKSLYDTMAALHASLPRDVAFDPENHFYASFGHLLGYGARYYGYLWSDVFAQDVFAEIQKHGLLNPGIGARYVHAILSKGGSKDPYDLLRAFLGREPRPDAFFASLGFDVTHEPSKKPVTLTVQEPGASSV